MQPSHVTQHMTSVGPELSASVTGVLGRDCLHLALNSLALSLLRLCSHTLIWLPIDWQSDVIYRQGCQSFEGKTKQKQHFQCSCHVVGGFLYFFFLFSKTL